MIFNQDRQQIRQFFSEVWAKFRAQSPLEPLEKIIADIVTAHPEYHALLEAGEDALERDYLPETGLSNPFLHLGLHIALQEQLVTNRPTGIREVYQALCMRFNNAHEAEHRMQECLGEALWRAQQEMKAPDEMHYMACLRKLGTG